jgi:long-chain alkane monooxygenase
MSGWSSIDFGRFNPADAIKKEETNAIHSFVESLAGGDRTWTIKDLAQWGGVGGVGPVFVGSPATVADILQEWVEETDVDGFNLAYAVTHETFEDIVNLLVPELQRRGVYPSAYGPGSTLREKLFSARPYLPANHPAAQYRDIEPFKRKQVNAALRRRRRSRSFRKRPGSDKLRAHADADDAVRESGGVGSLSAL